MFAFAALLSACNDDVERTKEEDEADLAAYLSDNNISTAPRESGVIYLEKKEGLRFPVVDGEFIIFNYSVKTITGMSISEDVQYWIDASAVNIIPGLLEGISLMNEGGEATIIVPSELAYGSSGHQNIEENMSLIFDIVISEVKGPEEEKIRLQEFVSDSGIVASPTASGLYFLPIDSGNGQEIITGDNLLVKYTGKYLNGTVFDETQGVKFFDYSYRVTSVIRGFEEGIGLMKHGGKASFIIPYQQAYKEQGSAGVFPYSTIIFDVELILIED